MPPEASSEPGSTQEIFPIVGIGASAGGLEALTALLLALPIDTGLAFVVIQHLDPKHESMLPDILARSTPMPVRQVSDGMLVDPNHVYVIPANNGLAISQRILQLTPREASAELRLPIDAFLRSLAQSHKNGAIAVILSGTGSDGALGLEAIKAEGGITFAQDGKSAKFAAMPHNAVATGCVDFILPPAEIARELARIGRHPYTLRADIPVAAESHGQPAQEFRELFGLLEQGTDIDFSVYRRSTIERRVRRRQALHNTESLEHYLKYLHENPAEVQALQQDLLIKVTQFFRDPEVFDALKSQVIPQLLKKRSAKEALRLWIPGCATGEEAYSLAICMLESLDLTKNHVPIRVFASDINPASIERARAGVYPENITADVTPERLERFFVRTHNRYRIKKDIRDLCIFAVQNLIADPPYSHLDLISCRNVLIYMGSIQKSIISLFHYALKPTGYLVLGTAESANAFSDLFAAVDKPHKIYSRKEGSTPPLLHYARPKHAAAQEGDRSTLEEVSSLDFQKLADRVVLEKYGPPRVIIDEHLEVIEIGGAVGPYLEVPQGRASLHLLKMVRGAGLRIELHATIEKAKKEGSPVRKERIRVEQGKEPRDLNIEVVPLSAKYRRTFLVLFDERPPTAEEKSKPPEGEETLSPEQQALRERDFQILRLNEELAQTRQHLLSMIEEHSTAGEEAQTAEEEAQSNIEELQSLNEEMETAKEEMQSANEELNTINEELETRNVELSQSRDFAQSIVESVRQPLLALDTEMRVKSANQAFYQCFETTPGSTEGQLLYRIEGGLWDIPELRTLLREVLPANESFNDFEVEREFGKAGHKSLLISARQLGKVQMILFSINDITERRKAEVVLRSTEDRLRHAQKMEAIGRLAGGVAHEFNNLLTGILGYSDLLLDSIGIDNDEQRRKNLQVIIRQSAQRAAELTKHLLAFSRRQVLQPKVLTLKSVVADLEPMLRRVLGEHIDLVISLGGPRGFIQADPGQIGQVIMNLVLNARDAMLLGGTLTIVTQTVHVQGTAPVEDLKPGRYVMLAVKDTGIGMDKETQSHLYEPFFTTKGHGLGTGLGLATVFGIVEQSGAQIRFSTELGHGTTFKIFFPRVTEPARLPETEKPQALSEPLSKAPSGSEIVLLVEDEDTVRNLARTLLESKGYKVLEARHGGEALAVCKKQEHIDLLLTDVVMPGMGGRLLAEEGARLYPEMKVLFMSGYADDTLVREGIKIKGTPFLQKPFTLQQLARKVRDVLDIKGKDQV